MFATREAMNTCGNLVTVIYGLAFSRLNVERVRSELQGDDERLFSGVKKSR